MKTYLFFFGKSQDFTFEVFDEFGKVNDFNKIIKDFDLLESEYFNIDDINKIFSNKKDNKDTEENKDENDGDNEKVKQSIKILKENINKRHNKDDYNSFIEFVETELEDVKSLIENMKIK